VLIERSFILNKLGIINAALSEQFPKNTWRSAEAGTRDLFSTIEFSSLILAPEHKQMAIIPNEKASIPGCIV
jgi:hypothetical protein